MLITFSFNWYTQSHNNNILIDNNSISLRKQIATSLQRNNICLVNRKENTSKASQCEPVTDELHHEVVLKVHVFIFYFNKSSELLMCELY